MSGASIATAPIYTGPLPLWRLSIISNRYVCFFMHLCDLSEASSRLGVPGAYPLTLTHQDQSTSSPRCTTPRPDHSHRRPTSPSKGGAWRDSQALHHGPFDFILGSLSPCIWNPGNPLDRPHQLRHVKHLVRINRHLDPPQQRQRTPQYPASASSRSILGSG